MRRNLHWVMGLSFGSLLLGCAGESLAPGEGAEAEPEAGEQQQALTFETGCEGMMVNTPASGRFKYVHMKAGTDTTIRAAQPNTNFQDEARCYTSDEESAREVCLLRFPIDLPATAQIQFAQLSMRLNTVAAVKFKASTMNVRWFEGTSTWNNYQSTATWTTPGAWLDQRDSFCTLTSRVGRTNYNLDGFAISQIQDWVSGRAENSGIGIFADAESYDSRLIVYSSENASDDQPELNLWYTDEPVASQTVTLAAVDSTTIDQTQPTKNFAAQPACEISRSGSGNDKQEKTCLLRWDLSQIPKRSIVTRVELNVGNPSSNFVRWEIYPLHRAWVEEQVTWNEFATGSRWKKAGAYDSDDVGGTSGFLQIASAGPKFQLYGSFYELVESWVNDASTNQGVLLGLSRKSPLQAAPMTLPKAPTLRVTFTPPPWQ